jgi:glutamate synthase (NADPH/NADH) small chain
MAKVKNVKTIPKGRTPMAEQDPQARGKNFEEVALGYTLADALREADRCIECKKPRCIAGCPVGIDIPGFIRAIGQQDMRKAYEILRRDNPLPAVCGRVCPQETQCEILCIVGVKAEPVCIGRLERFAADYAMAHFDPETPAIARAGKKAAIIGSGPAGVACAADLARAGVDVTIFEALHMAGGVLKYGIPEFRLPKVIVDREIELLKQMGVKIELNTVIGKLFTIPQLMQEKGFDVVFIGTGAGSPKFQGIPGENLNGVFSANEFLTRVNLMRGFRFPEYDTPVGMGRRVAVIGAGNTAMDCVRCALRMGAEKVTLVYRRTQKESPARAEELHHAMEEGIEFQWLTNPVKILGDAEGWVIGMECIRMVLGEPDASGRRAPVEQPGTNFVIPVDSVIYALGTRANPIIARSTPGLKTNQWGYIEVDEQTGMSSRPGVFAGGDIVTGAATVILALGAGRRAAKGMLQYMGLLPAAAPAEAAAAKA